MVKRIYIYSYEEAKQLAPKSKSAVVDDTTKLSGVDSSHESVTPRSGLDYAASFTNTDC